MERNKLKFEGLKKDSLIRYLPLKTEPFALTSPLLFQLRLNPQGHHIVILVTISQVVIFIYLMSNALFPLVLITLIFNIEYKFTMERMVILLYHLFPLIQVGQASLLSHKTLAAYLRLQNHLGLANLQIIQKMTFIR